MRDAEQMRIVAWVALAAVAYFAAMFGMGRSGIPWMEDAALVLASLLALAVVGGIVAGAIAILAAPRESLETLDKRLGFGGRGAAAEAEIDSGLFDDGAEEELPGRDPHARAAGADAFDGEPAGLHGEVGHHAGLDDDGPASGRIGDGAEQVVAKAPPAQRAVPAEGDEGDGDGARPRVGHADLEGGDFRRRGGTDGPKDDGEPVPAGKQLEHEGHDTDGAADEPDDDGGELKSFHGAAIVSDAAARRKDARPPRPVSATRRNEGGENAEKQDNERGAAPNHDGREEMEVRRG